MKRFTPSPKTLFVAGIAAAFFLLATFPVHAQTALERWRDAQQRADQAWEQLAPEDQQAAKDQAITRGRAMRQAGEEKWDELTPEQQDAAKEGAVTKGRQMRETGEEKWQELSPEEQEKYKEEAKDVGSDAIQYRRERFGDRFK